MTAVAFPHVDLVEDAFGHWLAGFIDGEGCFFFHKKKGQFSPPQFQLKLRDDDREILDECVRRTSLGRVIPVLRRGASKPQSKWLITKRADCVALVRLLDRCPLRAKKRRDFAIWREAVALWNTQKKVGRAGGGTSKYQASGAIQALRWDLTKGRAYASETRA